MAPRGSAAKALKTNEATPMNKKGSLSLAVGGARKGTVERLTIAPPNILVVQFDIRGTAPYVQNKFSAKAEIMKTQQEGSTAKSKKQRSPKDFDRLYKLAQHKSTEGWHGQPAAGYRNACIEACRLVNYHMTKAKMSIFVIGDGFDDEGTPLIKMTGMPERIDSHVRNATGVIDVRARPMWKKWTAKLNMKYDADQFTEDDVANLVARAGLQVGIGEGRPFSKDSAGMGWGTFEIV